MLAGLDQIEWNELGFHVYGKNDTIPAQIRALLSPDLSKREYARDFLLGEGQDFGDIYDTTPYILPFLIELLADEKTPEKAELLWHMSAVAECIHDSKHLSVHMMRLCVQVYDAFKSGLGVLIDLLKDESIALRADTANLLQYLSDDVEILIPELMACFQSEAEEEVQVAILKSLKSLLHSLEWPQEHLKADNAQFFSEVVEGHPSLSVRVAAARSAVELVPRLTGRYDRLSPGVPKILAEEFLALSTPLDSMEASDPAYHAEGLVKDLAKLEPETLLNLMQRPEINTDQAHLLGRGLLLSGFRYEQAHDDHWEYFPDFNRAGEGNYYLSYHGVKQLLEYGQKKELIRAIVDNQKFWDLPTNIFSFFYGLPDEREALQALSAD